MIKLTSLILEAFVPDKSEFENAFKRSEYNIIDVYMDRTGKVYIDDRESKDLPVDRKNVISKLTLDYNNKKISIFKDRLHGNKINPHDQQLLSSLQKKNIIDSNWKVSFSDKEGYYKKGEYVYKLGEFENLPPNFWKRNQRIDVGNNLILYHGTSEKELPTIQKYGLRPLGSKYTSPGGETRLRIEENKNILYLSGTFTDAFRYAQLKARWNMREENKEKYSWVEHHEWERWFIKPVVLLVRIPDFTKLRSDDDRIISLIKIKSDELWEKMDSLEKQKQQKLSSEWFNERNVKYSPNDINSYLWTISDNGFKEVIKHISKDEWNNWKESLKTHNQVGYVGIIPPNYITVVDLNKVFKK